MSEVPERTTTMYWMSKADPSWGDDYKSLWARHQALQCRMFETIRTSISKEKAEAELQEKLRQQREACLEAVDSLDYYESGCPEDHMNAILNAKIDD